MATGTAKLNTGASYEVRALPAGPRLSDVEQAWIKSALAQAFPDYRISDYFDAQPQWFDHYDYLFVSVGRADKQLVGLLTARWLDVDLADAEHTTGTVLQATAQFIAPDWQGSSMLRDMWRHQLAATLRSEGGFPEFIVLKTCHPLAFAPMMRFAACPGVTIYPNVKSTVQDEAMKIIAVQIANAVSPGKVFHPDTGKLGDVAVPRGFYPELPSVRTQTPVSQYFREHLTPDDRILCITRIATAQARRVVLQAFGVSEH